MFFSITYEVAVAVQAVVYNQNLWELDYDAPLQIIYQPKKMVINSDSEMVEHFDKSSTILPNVITDMSYMPWANGIDKNCEMNTNKETIFIKYFVFPAVFSAFDTLKPLWDKLKINHLISPTQFYSYVSDAENLIVGLAIKTSSSVVFSYKNPFPQFVIDPPFQNEFLNECRAINVFIRPKDTRFLDVNEEDGVISSCEALTIAHNEILEFYRKTFFCVKEENSGLVYFSNFANDTSSDLPAELVTLQVSREQIYDSDYKKIWPIDERKYVTAYFSIIVTSYKGIIAQNDDNVRHFIHSREYDSLYRASNKYIVNFITTRKEPDRYYGRPT